MGFWKDVWYDVQHGMSQSKAIELNAKLRYSNMPEEEKKKLQAVAEAEIKLNSMP